MKTIKQSTKTTKNKRKSDEIKTITDEQIQEISEWMVDHGYLSYEEFVESIKKGETAPFW